MKSPKVVLSVALLSLLLFGHTPVHAATATNAEKLVRTAESYAGSLKWAISVEGTGDGKTIPWNYYNGTKTSYQKAMTAVSKLPKGKTKTDLQNRLEKNVNLYISTTPGKVGRAVAYIDAINAGLKIEKKKNLLNNRLASNIMDDKTEQYYHELSREIKKQAHLLDRVYGATTREKIRNHFKVSAEQARQNAMYPVSIFMALKQFKADLDIKYYIQAIPYQTEVEALFNDSLRKSMISESMYQQLYTQYEELQKRIPTILDLTFTDIEGKYSSIHNLDYDREFKTDPNLLNGFDTFTFRLYQEASHVTLTLSSEEISEVVFTGEDISNGEINLNEFKNKHQLSELKELTFEFTIIDKKGQVKIEKGSLISYIPFVFTNGTYQSNKGYSLDIPRNYELFLNDNGNETIHYTNEEAGDNWLSVKLLEPNSDLIKVREESIEFLKSAPGIPQDYSEDNPFAGTDKKVKMHLIVKNKYAIEEIIILEVNQQLYQFTSHIDATYLYLDVYGAFMKIMKSLKFN